MSNQEQTDFLVKLFGIPFVLVSVVAIACVIPWGIVFATVFYLGLIVSVVAAIGYGLSVNPGLTVKTGVVVGFVGLMCLTISGMRTHTATAPRSYSEPGFVSDYGTHSSKLGGSSNPFTQVDGYNEEDALIYAVLRNEGYSHEESAIATMKSAGW